MMRTRRLHLLTAVATTFLSLALIGCADNGGNSSTSSVSSSSSPVSSPVDSEELPDSSDSEELPDSSTSEELPDSSSSEELPDSSTSEELPDSSTSEELPDSSSSEELPDSSTSEELPDSSTSEELPDSSSSEELPDSSTSDENPDSSDPDHGGDEPSEDTHPATIHEETAPSDLNLYFFTDDFDSYNYLWGWNSDGSYLIQASGDQLVTVDGIDSSYTFVPYYITLDHEYDVTTDWENSAAGTLNLTGDFSNLFDGLLFRNADGSVKTDKNFYLDSDQISVSMEADGSINIFFYSNLLDQYQVAENRTFIGADAFNEGLKEIYDSEKETLVGADIHAETAPGDYNIYFGIHSGLGFEHRGYIYTIDPFNAMFQHSGDELVSIDGYEARQFVPFYLQTQKTYHAMTGWEMDGQTNFRIFDDLSNAFTKILFRGDTKIDNNGTEYSQTNDITLDQGKIARDEDGVVNIYIIENDDWSYSIYYSTAELLASVAA